MTEFVIDVISTIFFTSIGVAIGLSISRLIDYLLVA